VDRGPPAPLAEDVPQSDLDAADRRHPRSAALILIADQTADNRFDVERIASEDAAFDPFVAHGLYGFLLPFERRFTDAGEAGIRVQAQEQVVPEAGVGEEGFEARDFHQMIPSPQASLRACGFCPTPTARGLAVGLVPYRTAIGLPGDPDAPLSFSGAKMNANS